MGERVFCIDFGSAYTKVALRHDLATKSQLMQPKGVESEFWVPTVVAVDRRGTEPRLEFGDRAADLKTGGGIDVHADFKRHFFAKPNVSFGKPHTSPLDVLFQSDEFATLATKHAITPEQVSALRQLASVSKVLAGEPSDRGRSVDAQLQENAYKIACHFFRWLRLRVLDACTKLHLTALKFEDIPVRVAVPALASVEQLAEHPGCKLLLDALARAGWPLHPKLSLVTEPESNAIGVLTKAANVLGRNGHIHFGEMFSKGPLITVLKGDPNYPSYRALVIDIGAFTTDYATVFVKMGDRNPLSTVGVGFVVAQHSIPFAVSNLDASVCAALPKEKREWLAKAPRKEFSTFQARVYSEGKGVRPPGTGLVIGGEADREAVQACITDFAKRLADEATIFCSELEPAVIQELIITGGGSNIPLVREALQSATTIGNKPFVKTHAPDLKRVRGILTEKLDAELTRGASALGGASIYFEKDYY